MRFDLKIYAFRFNAIQYLYLLDLGMQNTFFYSASKFYSAYKYQVLTFDTFTDKSTYNK